MQLMTGQLPSPLGGNLIIWDEEERIYALEFEDLAVRMHSLLRRHHGVSELTPGRVPENISRKMEAFFGGDLEAIGSLPVASGGTSFQRDAWNALRKIPAGTTWSYQRQAVEIGRPRASRAVGAANAVNPVVIIVPCHRVIGRSGALTGYGGGLARKKWLLEHEQKFG